MNRNPYKRLGSGLLDADELKTHAFFSDIDFNKILFKKFKPPILSHEDSLSLDNKQIFNFGEDYIVNKDLTEDMQNKKKTNENEIQGWTFIGKRSKTLKNKTRLILNSN